jgi:ABC-type uncharacterized transport system substrate-binding protein
MTRFAAAALAVIANLMIAVTAASAHPHVWITMVSQVIYAPDGSVTGIRHAWTFDDMFSTFATQGLESKQKGVFTREELKPLAEVNVTSLKEYDFFTFAKTEGKKVEFVEPTDYYLEYKDQLLTLHFVLPLKTPLQTKALDLQIFDPSYFVDFSFDEKAKPPATLAGAPAQCTLTVGKPQEMDAKLAQQLSQLPPEARSPAPLIGAEYSNRLSIRCP